MINPAVSYRVTDQGVENAELTDDVQILSISGRSAARCTSRHGQITLPKHCFSRTKGHLSLWFSPMDDLGQHPMLWRCWQSNGIGHVIALVSDYPDGPEHEPASFGIFWMPHWGHPMLAKFAKGNNYPEMFHPHLKYVIEGNCGDLYRGHWYRLDLSFDHEAGEHALYLNGILAGRSDQFTREKPIFEACGPQLFLRSPQIAFGDTLLYPEPISPDVIRAEYEKEALPENKKIDEVLNRALTGRGNPKCDLQPSGGTWKCSLDLDLCDSTQMEHFLLQGKSDSLNWEDEGLRIATSQEGPLVWEGESDDTRQMYLWTKEMFSGDLYVRYEFMPLKNGGLSLLISRATGMQGEDFIRDYPLRTDGSMKTIHSSDIRMYHWEYYREMMDTRNDIPTHAIVKWPWERVLATGASDSPIRHGEWNKLEFRQIGSEVLGTINGELVIEGTDPPLQGHGPTLWDGHLAIRCMVRTEMRFRNLTIQTRTA